jgi:hypothetical protein
MTTTTTLSVAARFLLAGLLLGQTPTLVAQSSTARHVVTDAEYQRWKTELSNWGRWGKDDEIGALNLITPARRK